MKIIDSPDLNLIKERIENIQDRIDHAAQETGRNSAEIELIAVTKEKSAAIIKILLDNGISKIGESYLKEALFKIDLLKDYQLDWIMIGNIQSGKELQIARNFSEIHSIGRLRTAKEMNRRARQIERVLPVYLEFNVSGEGTKHGWEAWNEDLWENLLPEIEKITNFQNLKIKGLMTMAPYSINPEDSRPYFARLRKLGNYLQSIFLENNFSGLSMGMSGDFEVAIEEGSTVLRIGSALVGSR
jgi:pyridoxal phosphate enzyme (YggS family)